MYRTRQCRYDNLNRSLTVAGKTTRIRPKTARLLQLFLDNPLEILDKERLIADVWGHPHVDDQTLFQLISDIRAKFGDRDCLITHPGSGYQWAWPVRRQAESSRRRWHMFQAVAAALAVVAMVLSLGSVTSDPEQSARGNVSLTAFSPLIQHIQAGSMARLSGDEETAMAEFGKALVIEPDNVSVLLELSQSQWVLGLTSDALQTATNALSEARLQQHPVNEVIASLYLSHLSLQDGNLEMAMSLNQSARHLAEQNQLACATELTDRWDQQIQLAIHRHQQRDSFTAAHPMMLAGCQINAASGQS